MSHLLSKAVAPFFRSSSITLPSSGALRQRAYHRQHFRSLPVIDAGFCLPEYDHTAYIEYSDFVQRFKSLNPTKPGNDIGQTEIQEALRATVISIMGMERFMSMSTTYGLGTLPGQDLLDWSRLCWESRAYWATHAQREARRATTATKEADAGAAADGSKGDSR